MLLFSQNKTEQEHEKQIDNILKKERKKRKKMKKLGIDYDFPGYVSVVTSKAVHKLSPQKRVKKKWPVLFCCFFASTTSTKFPPPPLYFQDAEVKTKRAKQTRFDDDQLEEE